MGKTMPMLLAGLLLLTGCALEIRMTGYADPRAGVPPWPTGASFAVLKNDAAPNPLLDREIQGKIEALLRNRGYRLTDPVQAQCHLSFGYSIQPGLRTGTVTTFGPPRTQVLRVPDGKGGVTTTAVTVPGAATVLPVVTAEHERQISLKVADAGPTRNGGPERILWIGEASSLAPSSDLRTAVDFLLVAVFQFFGRDTGRQIAVSIAADHPDLAHLHGRDSRR